MDYLLSLNFFFLLEEYKQKRLYKDVQVAEFAAPCDAVELARIAKEGESEQARIGAIKEILDRAYGKAPQPMVGDEEGGPVKLAIEWLKPSDW